MDGLPAIDLSSAAAVQRTLREGAAANRDARCRRGSIDVLERGGSPALLIASGDLHDNPVHLARLAAAAGIGGDGGPRAHLTLHEIIHSDRLVNGVDLSHRALARVAALKAAHPETVHTLLANHELAQIVGSGIVKDGVRVVEAFNDGLDYAFGDDAGAVAEAIGEFVRSMPLALRCETPGGDVLCAHSLPASWTMDRFDPGVLDRDLEEADYEPRRGSAHLMVWGRDHAPEHLTCMGDAWGLKLFILGHEHAELGAETRLPNAVVVNSDHPRGVYVPINLAAEPPSPAAAVRSAVPLAPISSD